MQKSKIGRPGKTTLKNFLLTTNEKFYWLGFFLADGCATQKSSQFEITLSKIDYDHLLKFSCFIGGSKIKEYTNSIRTTACDKLNYDLIREKYGPLERKTINPPDIKSWALTNNQLFSLTVGFFDGDGHVEKIRSYSCGRIKCHGSWINTLEYIRSFWYYYLGVNTTGTARLNNRNHAVINFSANSMYLAKIKSIELNLPVMRRKWDLVKQPSIKSKKVIQ